MTLLDWVSVICVVGGVIMATEKWKSAFIVLMLGNIVTICNSYVHNRTDMILMYYALSAISIYGYFKWKKEEKK